MNPVAVVLGLLLIAVVPATAAQRLRAEGRISEEALHAVECSLDFEELKLSNDRGRHENFD